jgi:hypothetical protein
MQTGVISSESCDTEVKDDAESDDQLSGIEDLAWY